MPTVEFVEHQIRRREGFAVRFRYSGPGPTKGRNVRGDRMHVPSYPYGVRRRDSDTVAGWIDGRFRPTYAGFDVDVLDAWGEPVHGRTLLRTVRAAYDSR
jgi:hypothetical protein